MAVINNKFPQNDYFYPPLPDSSRIIVGCGVADYSASRIARAVEDCDAHLLNLNVTALSNRHDAPLADDIPEAPFDRFPVVVDLRVSHRNPAAIGRSLERYGYTVLDWQTPAGSADDETAINSINHLLRYLEI
ncbi:MAG: hypothetical protein K2L28_08105 [Muribaculaceae bacterium]|nr:hypothetical protein [Muribaculaceae bacterium]